MRTIERVIFATAANASALLLNIFLNAVFIFGLLGAPKMGIAGVALATTIARGIEFGICMLDALHFKVIRFRPAAIFERNKVLFADFMKYSLPAFGNEVSWGLAFSMYSVIMGHLGSDMVAANAVVVVARNLGTVACFGIANAGAILLGKSIGAGRMDTVKSDASKFCRITFVSGIVGGVFIFLLRPLFLNMADLTPTAQGYLNIMLFINMYYVLGQAMNTAVICGVFRSGGDSKWGFICDTIDMWVYAVPMGFLTAFLLKLPPMWVYFIICTDEFVKIPFVYKHYKSYKWIKNITREFLNPWCFLFPLKKHQIFLRRTVRFIDKIKPLKSFDIFHIFYLILCHPAYHLSPCHLCQGSLYLNFSIFSFSENAIYPLYVFFFVSLNCLTVFFGSQVHNHRFIPD